VVEQVHLIGSSESGTEGEIVSTFPATHGEVDGLMVTVMVPPITAMESA